tara:strand:- start:1543 stop:2415 length:873 start_codon:yes stop_codon:yes gene_type:complete
MTGLFKSIVPSAMNVFADGKQQTYFIKDRIPFVEAQISLNLPTPESILNLLPLITTPDEFANLQENFVKLKKACKKAEDMLNNIISQIDKALGTLDRVDQIFGTLSGFLDFISDFIPIIKLLISTGNIAIAAQIAPFNVQGVVLVRAGDAVKAAKGKLTEIDSLSKIISPLSSFLLQQTTELRDILYPVREKLNSMLIEVRSRCFYLDSVFIAKLKELELSMAQNPPTSGGGVGGPGTTGVDQSTEQIVDTLASQVNPELILDNLENSNKERVIQYLVESNHTGYQIARK